MFNQKGKGIVLKISKKGCVILAIVMVTALPWFICAFSIAGLRFWNPENTILLATERENASTKVHEWVSIQNVSPNVVQALIAAEDNRFCGHSGFDFAQISAAFNDWWNGEELRGASSISSQVIKNLFFLPERSWNRKIVEFVLTPVLELTQRKSRIMEIYLNIIPFGPGIIGIEMAAQQIFHKTAFELTMMESAALAAVLPSPSKLVPDIDSQRAKQIRREMNNIGAIGACAGGWHHVKDLQATAH